MNTKQKAKAFEYIQAGAVTGMQKFWENYDKLKGLPHNQILAEMGKLAAEEAEEAIISGTRFLEISYE